MNIRAMAERYRRQLQKTGARVEDQLARLLVEPRKDSHTQQILMCWYKHFNQTIGDDKDLKLLYDTHKKVTRANKLFGQSRHLGGVQSVVTRAMIQREFSEAFNQLSEFLKVLPELTERSLTISVQKSGIRLK